MKIVVIGNCQAFSFADYARHVLPGVEATLLDPFLLNDDAHVDFCVTALEGADHVFAQPMGAACQPAVRAAIESAVSKTTAWPGFGFDGFQPDQFYLYDAERKFVRTPMGDYNSLLIAAAFLGGRTPAQTERMFNSLSYGRLGYFEAFEKAKAAARKWLEREGIQLDDYLDGWLANGSFMLTINHPRMIVVAAIAKRAMAQAGLAIKDDGSLPADPLARLIWPVYPEIARRIGVPGSLNFVSDWGVPEPQILSLTEVIEGSFAVYDDRPIAEAIRHDPKVRRAAESLGFSVETSLLGGGQTPQPAGGPPTLTRLANALGSDRGTDGPHAHHYTRLYDMLLRPRRNTVRRMMEIGLCLGGPELGGDVDRQPSDAPSIRMWLDYFPQATVQGFDISDFSFFEHPRFEFSRGDAGSAADLLASVGDRHDYDLIVDDASHASFHQQNAFLHLFPRLRPGGLYIIEDLHWQSPFYEDRLPVTPKTADVFEQWFQTGGFPELPAAELDGFGGLAEDIDFAMVFQSPFRSEGWPKVAIIQKRWSGRNVMARPPVPLAPAVTPKRGATEDGVPIPADANEPRIKLLQSADPDIYAELLEASASINRAYAVRHGFGYSATIGIERGFHPWHACFNRILILNRLIAEGYRDWIFYLDADAYVFGQDQDVRDLIARAQKPMIFGPGGPGGRNWDLNDGVFLMNLGHPAVRELIALWRDDFLGVSDETLRAAVNWEDVASDQPRLHQILFARPDLADHIFIAERRMFNDYKASFVRHVLRDRKQDMADRIRVIRDDMPQYVPSLKSGE